MILCTFLNSNSFYFVVNLTCALTGILLSWDTQKLDAISGIFIMFFLIAVLLSDLVLLLNFCCY